MTDLTPLALKDAPALIEAVFPAQKVSFEAQSERKAVAAQTLTGLGSYWKGRKPLILVRAIVLGSLLPQTGDAEKDLEVFEMLMGFDAEGLACRALSEASLKASEIAMRISLSNPWDFFKHSVEETDPAFRRVAELKERLKNLPLSALSDRLGHRHEEPCRCRNSPPFPAFVTR